MSKQKAWAQMSPEEKDQIEKNRKAASYKNPFSGKNQAQRRRLHAAFYAMSK